MKAIIILLLSASAAFAGDTLHIADEYPIWMKDSKHFTDQTSAIYYMEKINGDKLFITCDDIGKLNFIRLNEAGEKPVLKIDPLDSIPEVDAYFKNYAKPDFEEIIIDKATNTMLLSVEGNGANFMQEAGVFTITSDVNRQLSVKKLELDPALYEHVKPNIGFEGLAITKHKIFFGLENIQESAGKFSDRTALYILDRHTSEFITVLTDTLNISTICGLYAVTDYELYGIDRNARSMFYINFNPDYSVRYIDHFPLELSIPGHSEINKILGTSVESITLDDEGNIYAVVDPWKEFYMPDSEDAKKLTDEELQNFKNYVPILYKYVNPIK